MESSARESPPAPSSLRDPVILIDGQCALCSAFAHFVASRDDGGCLRFAALGSGEAGWALSGFADVPRETIVLVEGGRLWTHSTAALKILAMLPLPWRAAGILLRIPRALRDPVYSAIARWRRHLFPGGGSCSVPSAALRKRLLTVPATPET